MKNKNGFGRFEVLTIIVILLGIGAYFGYVFLGSTDEKKLETMKNSAVTFSKTASVNVDSFHNSDWVYLQEVIDESLIGKIKSPVSEGYCSSSESYVEFVHGAPYVTLQCGDLVIDKANFSGNHKTNFYDVSKWSLEKPDSDDVEEKTRYNCLDENDQEIFDEYYDEYYFVYQVNRLFSTNYYFSNNVTACKVVSNTFYRTKKQHEK